MSHAEHFDAHGHKDHGHVIVSKWTLRLVLALLLFFTLLTVGLALFETWLGQVFHIELPNWLNVAVALSIATVKTIIVVAYFMQLKYDNPLNTMVFVFTILTVFSFIGFTALDLGGRGTLDRAKAVYVIEGGSGLTGVHVKGSVMDGLTNTPATEAAKIVARNAAAAGHGHDTHAAHAGHADHTNGVPPQEITAAGFVTPIPVVGSSRNVSRPVQGVTIPGLPGYQAPGHAADGHATGEKHDASAHDEKKPDSGKHDESPSADSSAEKTREKPVPVQPTPAAAPKPH